MDSPDGQLLFHVRDGVGHYDRQRATMKKERLVTRTVRVKQRLPTRPVHVHDLT